MKLENEKVRSDKYYRIGYHSGTGKYILASVVTWIAWYDRYYEISKDEYDLFENDIEALDTLADKLNQSGIYSERFLFSDKKEDNTDASIVTAERFGVTWQYE